MIKFALELLQKYRRFVIYSFIGVLGASTDIGVFYILNEELSLPYWLSNMYSVSLGVMVTFVLNTFFNFKVTDNIVKRFGIYSIVGVIGLIMQHIILYLFAEKLGFNDTVVKIAFTPIVAITQYTLNATFSFSERLVQQINDDKGTES